MMHAAEDVQFVVFRLLVRSYSSCLSYTSGPHPSYVIRLIVSVLLIPLILSVLSCPSNPPRLLRWFRVIVFLASLTSHPHVVTLKGLDDTIPTMPMLLELAVCDAFEILEQGHCHSWRQKTR